MAISATARRLLGRIRFWLEIFRHVSGTNIETCIGIVLSSIIDTCALSINPLLATSPKIYISGILYLKDYDAYFYVRKYTDDLYNVTPRREGEVNELILRSLDKGDVFIDVGANIGYYSILAAKIVGNKGQVVSLEPIMDTVKVLNLNISLNNLTNIKVVPMAAWNESAILTMYVPEGYFGWASPKKRQRGRSFTLNTILLDDVTEDFPAVKLLKVDVEGSERKVLTGAKKTLRKTQHVIMEVSENPNEIQQILKESKFTVRKLRFSGYIHAQKIRTQNGSF